MFNVLVTLRHHLTKSRTYMSRNIHYDSFVGFLNRFCNLMGARAVERHNLLDTIGSLHVASAFKTDMESIE